MRNQRTSILVIIVVAVAGGCERNWPPNAELIQDQFDDRQDDLEAVVAALAASEHREINSPDREAVFSYTYSDADGRVHLVRRQLEGEVAERWLALLLAANVPEVRRLDSGLVVAEASHLIGRPHEVYWQGFFRYDPGYETNFASCRNHYREAPCGNCGMRLNDDWWLSFHWSPMALHEELTKGLAEGADGTRRDELQSRVAECFAQGADIIDYVGDAP